MVTITGRYGISKARLNCTCKKGRCFCNVYYDGKKKETLTISERELNACRLRGKKAADCTLEAGSRTPTGPKAY